MDLDINTVRIAITLASFGLFLGIIAWAVDPAKRRDFDEAAAIPLDDDAGMPTRSHGKD